MATDEHGLTRIKGKEREEKKALAWKCKCPCHKVGAMVDHPVPCCVPCPHCKKYFARGMLKEHLKDCKKRQKV